MNRTTHVAALFVVGLGLSLAGCFSETPEGLASAPAAKTTVKMDFLAKPLPEIPLPNDIATRYDADSATLRRVNASLIAPTGLEGRVRRLIDGLDGWGVNAPITIPFTAPLDIQTIVDAHDDADYDLSDDVIYLIDVDPDSPEFGEAKHLDIGNGNFPVVLERMDYWDHDPRGHTVSLFFEEVDEDLNGDGVLTPGEDTNRNGILDDGEDLNDNGVLDPPEDTDADGVLDRPNYLPGANPDPDDLGARTDALMYFYERETDTLIVRPMVPLRERTTYAVVVTRRLLDADGQPVGSPFPSINHVSQNDALAPLPGVLPAGLSMDDVAFTWTFTTQSLKSNWIAVRDGLYGHGVQGHLGRDYPAVLDEIYEVRNPGHANFPGMDNPFILPAEDFLAAFDLVATGVLGLDAGTKEYDAMLDSHRYIDYHVMGRFNSPQLFEREAEATGDDQGPVWLPFDEQSWPEDLDRVPATTRDETIHFWLTIPRPEVTSVDESAGEQVPLVLFSHGHGSNRLEMIGFAGFLAKNGVATLGIDCVSHGPNFGSDGILVKALFEGQGMSGVGDALLIGRAHDQNADGVPDSGADFWTSYLFHTRDVVRQCGLDYMQLARIVRSFDGERRWAFDVNGDGINELAGDFNADGHVVIGKDSVLTMAGGSLGGIMAGLLGGLEPELSAVVPVSAGSGLGDVGNRSQQGAVRRAVMLRVMGPLFVGTLNAETHDLAIQTIVPEGDISAAYRPMGVIPDVMVGDTLVIENLDNDERGCGYVTAAGGVRVTAPSDEADRIRLLHYRGPALVTGDENCRVVDGATPEHTLDTFEADISFHGKDHAAGDTLITLAEGYGERRATPGMRRFLGLGQLVLDGGDPGAYIRHMQLDRFTYPGTGQTTGAHAMIVTTVGDTVVPASTGMALARNAGLIDYLNVDDRYGVPPNQVLIDNYVPEAVHTLARFTDPNGDPVHIDVENFSDSDEVNHNDTFDVPRLDPPLRLGFNSEDLLGGKSAAVFPYAVPHGAHAFPLAGRMTDIRRDNCRHTCAEDQDQDCGDCDTLEGHDVGIFIFNMMGQYLETGGQVLNPDPCQGDDSCAHHRPVPELYPAGSR